LDRQLQFLAAFHIMNVSSEKTAWLEVFLVVEKILTQNKAVSI